MNKLGTLFFVSFTITLLLFGCSHSDLYEMGQDYQRDKCREDAITAEQHIACENVYEKTYKQYKKERKAVLEEN